MATQSRRNSHRKKAGPSDRPATAVFPHSDPLTGMLDGLNLRCMMPSAHQMTAPWGVQFGWYEPRRARKHLESIGVPMKKDPPTMQGEIIAILSGKCCMELPSQKIKLTLGTGDVVLIARKDPFILRDKWSTHARNIHQLGNRENLEQRRGVRHGGGGEPAAFLAGPFFLEDEEFHPLLLALPPVMHIRNGESPIAAWLQGTLELMNDELAGSHPGSQSIVNHLAHVLFVQGVRASVASLPGETTGNWFRAVFDAELAPVMGAMHSRLDEPWTVATLADHASMSRSVFSARFTALMGIAPMHYLTDCRMRKAKALLRESRIGVKTIAAKVGYSNESAFSNAFRRMNHTSPGGYRKSQTSGDAERG
jgi:AraC-like DNA-binding protein